MSITWTSNGKIWLALHGDQWVKIENVENSQHPYHVYIGYVIPVAFSEIRIEHEIDTELWYVANKISETLEEAQAWTAEKLGIES